MTFGEVAEQLAQVSDGPCASDPQLKILTFQAVKALFDSGYYVGSFAELDIHTFTGNFSLPYGYERVVEVSQCMSDGGINQAWCSIQSDTAFLEPEQWQDGELISLSDGPLERPLLADSILSVRPDNPLDTGIQLTVTGILPSGNVASLNSGECEEFIQISANTYQDGLQTYAAGSDGVLSLRKPVTKGPVRVYAYQGVKRYLICVMQPFETEALRRRYRFPEIVIPTWAITGVTYEVDHVLLDTGYPSLPLCAGNSLYITGFCPGYVNGLWTIASVAGGVIRIDGSFSAYEGTITQIFGQAQQLACVRVTALKRPVPIVSDSQDLIFRNLLAIQLALRAVVMPFGNNLDEYQKCMDAAKKLLVEEVTRYGQDATRALARKSSLRYDLQRYPFGTLGYVRARLMLDLPGGLKVGKREMTRMINEVQERFIMSGKWSDTTSQRQYEVDANNCLVLEKDALSLLVASICGQQMDIEDEYFPAARPSPNLNTWGYGNRSIGGAPLIYNNMGGCKWKAIDYGRQEIYDGQRAYQITPCAIGKCVTAVVKLNYVPQENDTDTLLVTNYVAIKTCVEAFVARDAKDMNTYNSLEGKAFSILEKAKGQKRGGARAIPRFQTFMKSMPGYGLR